MGCTPAEKRSRWRNLSVPLFLFRCFLLVFPLFIPCVSLAVPPTVVITSPSGLTNDNTPLLIYTVSEGTVVVKLDGTVVPKVSGDSLDILDGQQTSFLFSNNVKAGTVDLYLTRIGDVGVDGEPGPCARWSSGAKRAVPATS